MGLTVASKPTVKQSKKDSSKKPEDPFEKGQNSDIELDEKGIPISSKFKKLKNILDKNIKVHVMKK